MKKFFALLLGAVGLSTLLSRKAEGSLQPDFTVTNREEITTLDLSSIVPKQLDPFKAARGILDLIGQAEAQGNYNVSYGSGKYGSANLTNMTLDEVRNWQETLLKNQRDVGIPVKNTSSAVGKYQFIRSTFDATRNALGLSGDTKFTPEIQDRMAYYQLEKVADWSDFLGGQITIDEVMLKISKIWASFPKDFTGISYYAGVANNKALVSPNQVTAELKQAREVA